MKDGFPKSVDMSVNFIVVLLLGKHVNCHLDISSDSAKTVISHDSPQNDEGCNLDPFLTKDNANPGGQIEAEAIGVTKDGGKSDAAAKKFGSSSSAGSGGAVVEAKDDLPCSAPLTGYQQDDPILVRSSLSTLQCYAMHCSLSLSSWSAE